jgi:hypothetical protein
VKAGRGDEVTHLWVIIMSLISELISGVDLVNVREKWGRDSPEISEMMKIAEHIPLFKKVGTSYVFGWGGVL